MENISISKHSDQTRKFEPLTMFLVEVNACVCAFYKHSKIISIVRILVQSYVNTLLYHIYPRIKDMISFGDL